MATRRFPLASFVAVAAVSCASARAPQVPVGVARLEVWRGDRDLAPRIWYRAVDGVRSEAWSPRPVFVGEWVSPGAAPLDGGPRPLVVLSHGYWGGTFSQGWLASRLVERGFVVLSLQHPGTMTDSQTAEGRVRLWERARDVSYTIDRVLADPVWGPRIDRARIGFVGHSFGAWTGVALAGGVYDWHRQLAACREMVRPDLSCKGFLGDTGAGVSLEGNARPMADARIRAFVLLAPGGVGGFAPESLATIRAPVLVVGAGHDDITDFAANSEVLAAGIRQARVSLLDTDHFAFIPRCNWKGKILLRLLCKDGGAERESLHAIVGDEVTAFLAGALVGGP